MTCATSLSFHLQEAVSVWASGSWEGECLKKVGSSPPFPKIDTCAWCPRLSRVLFLPRHSSQTPIFPLLTPSLTPLSSQTEGGAPCFLCECLNLPQDGPASLLLVWMPSPRLRPGRATDLRQPDPGPGLGSAFPHAFPPPTCSPPPRHGQPTALRPELGESLRGGPRGAGKPIHSLPSILLEGVVSLNLAFPKNDGAGCPRPHSGPAFASDTGWEDSVALPGLAG